MSLLEIAPAAQSLPRAEKLQLVQLLVNDLAREDGLSLLEPGASYPILSPLEAHGAARTMLKTLDSKKRARKRK